MSICETALGQLLHLAGRAAPDFLTIESGKPALKTRFFAEEAAASALAAGACVAADIWMLRTGEKQNVQVSTREAAAGLVSFVHQKFEDESRAPPLRGQLDASRSA